MGIYKQLFSFSEIIAYACGFVIYACTLCMFPHATGEYKFAVTPDNASEVWFSSDHQPANLKKDHVLDV